LPPSNGVYQHWQQTEAENDVTGRKEITMSMNNHIFNSQVIEVNKLKELVLWLSVNAENIKLF
jgi:hypothetical protein